MPITIRHIEPSDYEALHKIFCGPKVMWGTLQMPYPSAEMWRKRLAEPPEGLYSLVACVDDEVVGQWGCTLFRTGRAADTSDKSAWRCAMTGKARVSARQ